MHSFMGRICMLLTLFVFLALSLLKPVAGACKDACRLSGPECSHGGVCPIDDGAGRKDPARCAAHGGGSGPGAAFLKHCGGGKDISWVQKDFVSDRPRLIIISSQALLVILPSDTYDGPDRQVSDRPPSA